MTATLSLYLVLCMFYVCVFVFDVSTTEHGQSILTYSIEFDNTFAVKENLDRKNEAKKKT